MNSIKNQIEYISYNLRNNDLSLTPAIPNRSIDDFLRSFFDIFIRSSIISLNNIENVFCRLIYGSLINLSDFKPA